MKYPLIIKLLAINLVVIAIVIVCVWLAVDYLAADYFSALMEQYHISPTDTHGMFLASVHRYLVIASLIGVIAAIGMGFLLTRRVLRPLSEMGAVITTFAAGDYTTRVGYCANDEIGRLGLTFNRMADSLQRLEELRRNMVVDVAHELRTPLTNIRGYLEAMQDSVVSVSAETIELLHGEVLRLIQLVEDLQRLARADAAKGHVNRADVDFAELVEQVSRLYQPQFSDKRIRIETAVASGAPTVKGDPDKLLQVISNLVQNACRYVPRGGTVRIATQAARDGLEISVENSGEKIPERELSLMFERFYRPDKSRSRDSGGAGIGLAIVKQLVEAHGGEVGAENRPNGVRVWFRLPG